MKKHFALASFALAFFVSGFALAANEPAVQESRFERPSDCNPACTWTDKSGNKHIAVTRAYVSPDFVQPAANIRGLSPVRAKDVRGTMNVQGL